MNSELPKPIQTSDSISLIYLRSEISQWMSYIKWLWLYQGVAILSWPQRFESQGLYTRSRKVGDNKMPEGWLDGLLYSYCVVLGYKLLNTQYMKNSTIIYPLKMEYVWNFWPKVSISIWTLGLMDIHHKPFFWEIPPWGKKAIFVTDFVQKSIFLWSKMD